MSDEQEIRELIESWAQAVQRQDLEGILDRHTADMVMYDVPPPNELRGIDAYRQSWPPFFEAMRDTGIFALQQIEVTAGDRVAFATALLRCQTNPGTGTGNRLRLSVGLRKEEGRWMIAHEHHSFPQD